MEAFKGLTLLDKSRVALKFSKVQAAGDTEALDEPLVTRPGKLKSTGNPPSPPLDGKKTLPPLTSRAQRYGKSVCIYLE